MCRISAVSSCISIVVGLRRGSVEECYRVDLQAIVEHLAILWRIASSIPQAKAAILSDSRSALEKLEVLRGAERQQLVKSITEVLQNAQSLVLQYIPAHCRIEGNERENILEERDHKWSRLKVISC
ncbi:hypothetical protein ElyMa_005221800 [Elysia marginata]|uniref:RNase H type-1 domain-containing protein n=1 Tax=Elysia marginata TaxID=1093978 RepID=A0AAV4JV35_9GAST|nr:hypothetical protein ElyMa_005221800 [Elysia marginata]